METFRRVLLAGAIVLMAGPVGAAEEPVIEIVDWGLTAAKEVGSEVSPDTPTGINRLVEGPVDVTRANEIHACIGTSFGIVYRAAYTGEASVVPIKVVVDHPLIRTPDGRAMEHSSWPDSAILARRYAGWVFEENFELVPGRWKISLRDLAGSELASKTFTVSTGSCPIS
ncbi:protein of unknown function [Phyllobacterium sp. YR620]|uniref:DUF3859 domain-containing protein n=1 Tax=Phyllobacterium sp. YR620 TaxID=1881066 RepID=UPI00088C45C9|nr:DUF3859 domain-containing protein [Phyllobacterium sp. YR620]SDP80433.1 protein of unknown function [Phyllobacterium sp. YR620]